MANAPLSGLNLDANLISDFFVDISPSYLLVLDAENRFLFANKITLEFLGKESLESIRGMKFGDADDCDYARIAPDGCGSSPHCPTCGLYQALFASKSGDLIVREFTLVSAAGQSVIFRSRIKSILVKEETLTAISMQDISNEKRRETLEKVFFHDLLNAAAGLTGLLEIIDLDNDDVAQASALLKTAKHCADYLVDEINFSRSLVLAETNALELRLEPVRIDDLLEKATGLFSMQTESGMARLEVTTSAKKSSIISDKSLLVRILVNLIKNAIEAGEKGALVTVRVEEGSWNVRFEVHNESVMPFEVKEQIFRRAFSTKGKGRGTGTYSVQLFTEQYLKGRVWFTSEEGSGTSFFVEIPTVLM